MDEVCARTLLRCKIHFILAAAPRLGMRGGVGRGRARVSRNSVKHYSTLHFTRWRTLGELFQRLLLAEPRRIAKGEQGGVVHAWNCSRRGCRASALSAWIIACLMTGVSDKTRFQTISRREAACRVSDLTVCRTLTFTAETLPIQMTRVPATCRFT